MYQNDLTHTERESLPPMSRKFSKGDRATLVIPDTVPQHANVPFCFPIGLPVASAQGHEFIIIESTPSYREHINQWCWSVKMVDLPFWGVLPENWLQAR